jgi:hypothetical protein
LLAVALVGCAASDATRTPRPDLYVLTAANELIGATAAGRVVMRRQLERARRGTSPSRRLAVANGHLFVLVRRDAPPDRLVVVDAASGRVRATRSLPADFRARVVVAGARLFVAGNRAVRRVAPGLDEEDSVVLELDGDGRLLGRFTVREAAGRDWWVTSAALSPDGRRLVVSYHGGCSDEAPDLCTGGADIVDVETGQRAPCDEPFRGSGCFNAHGDVDFHGDGLLAATGSGLILRLDRNGREREKLATRLGNSHVMDFAVDRERSELVAAGPCQHFGGLASLRLDDGRARLLVRPGPPHLPQFPPTAAVCGTRVALLRTLVAVAPIRTAVASPSGRGRVLLVDRRTGRIRARITLGAEPVDVAAVRRAR